MHYGIGTNPEDMLSAVIILTEDEWQKLREGNTSVIRFREGTPVPFDVYIQRARDDEQAHWLMSRCPPKPGCIALDANDLDRGGVKWLAPETSGVTR